MGGGELGVPLAFARPLSPGSCHVAFSFSRPSSPLWLLGWAPTQEPSFFPWCLLTQGRLATWNLGSAGCPPPAPALPRPPFSSPSFTLSHTYMHSGDKGEAGEAGASRSMQGSEGCKPRDSDCEALSGCLFPVPEATSARDSARYTEGAQYVFGDRVRSHRAQF